MLTIRRVAAPLILALLAVPSLAVEPAAAATTSATIVSRAATGAQLDGSSQDIVLSADGRYVAFSTDAEFYPGDDNSTFDVFRKDLLTGALEAISVNDDGQFGDFDSYSPSITADGSRVAFLSDDDDVLDLYDDNDRDQNGSTDLYIRDVNAGTTRPAVLYDPPGIDYDVCFDNLACTPTDGVEDGEISRDGNHVVVATSTTLNATEAVDDFDVDVYVRTLSGSIYRRVSRYPTTNSTGGGNAPSISATGRYVAFESSANNITAAIDNNGLSDIYVFDRDADNDGVFDEVNAVSTQRISVASGAEPNGASTDPAVSGDGRYVAFASQATNLGGPYRGIYLRDRSGAGSTSWVSPSFGAPDGEFANPVVSDDGRYVAFASDASTLAPGDAPGTSDIFRRDRSAATTLRVTEGNNGAQPTGQSFGPSISPSGSVVGYSSAAGNLVPTDTNSGFDVFVWAPLNDLSAPFVTMLRPAKRFTTAAPTGQWYGFDTSTVGTYDVQRKVANYNQSLPNFSALLNDTTLTVQTLDGVRGRTYCWRARAEDIHGNLSGYTAGACTALPLGSSSLAASTGWTQVTGSQYYADAGYRATTPGRKLKRTNVVAERIAIVATTCSNCGSVKVTFGTSSKTITLVSSTTKRKQVIEVFVYSSARAGTITIETTGTRPVLIEGLGVYKD